MVGSVHAFYLVVLTRQGAPVIDELDRLKGGGNDILKVRNWEDGRWHVGPSVTSKQRGQLRCSMLLYLQNITIRATLTVTEKQAETEKFGRKYWFRPKEVQNGARTHGLARKTSSGAQETRQAAPY
jgi:hypothetical protein